MSQEFFDFETPDYLEAEAIGHPGNRRFRVIARQGTRTACLWLEREQLRSLIETLLDYLVQLTGEEYLRPADAPLPPPPPPRSDFPEAPDLELQVGPLQIGFDETNKTVILLVAPVEVIETEAEIVLNESASPQFRTALSIDAIRQFARDAESVIAAGRPRCPLCGHPLNAPNEPHGCVKQNGHRHLEA
jgi:uncharacterized repeat protein (TIGR03847 family)